MQWRFPQAGATMFALLLLVMPLLADITLPTAAPSPPPQADAHAVRVWRGDRAIIPLRGHYSGSGTVTFWIVDPPEHGTLSELRPLGDNRATIIYQNDGLEPAANDRFTYLVKTSSNRVSSPAEVRIVVDEPPPHLQVPGRIEFDQILAGESQRRDLTITNDGGGILEGRLTVSAPWRLGSSEYRVASGKTATIAVVFRPEEGRDYVGQITLAGDDGALSSVALEGSATSPIALAPAELRIAQPGKKDEPRAGSFSLTNRTERPLALKFTTGRHLQPLADVTLAPAEEKIIPVVVSADGIVAVNDTIVVRGDGFSEKLPVTAEALAVAEKTPARPPPAIAQAATASPSPSATIPARASVVRPDEPAPVKPVAPNQLVVPVRAQRLEGARWELRWARPKESVAQYRIEERLLLLDGAGALQTNWHAFAAPKIAIAGDAVTAQLSGLDPRQIHSLRVTALGADGAALWESPLVVVGPPPQPSHRVRNWTIILGLALLVLVVVRWRANRASP